MRFHIRTPFVALLLFAGASLKAQDSTARFQFRGNHLGDSVTSVTGRGRCRESAVRGESMCTTNEMEQIGKVDVKVLYTFLDDRLVSVALEFDSGDFDKLSEILTAGYGLPIATDSETASRELKWRFADGMLVVQKDASVSRHKGQATVLADGWSSERSRRKAEAAKQDAARDLLSSRKP